MSDTIELCLDEIVVNEQARKHFELTGLRALGANIQEHGLYNPLLVKRLGERYVLVAGERRKRAMELVGIKKAEAIILPDDADAEVVQWIENAQRSDLLPAEKANALRMAKERKGWSNKEIAEHLHMDKSLPGRYLSLFETIPAVQEAAAAGKIGLAAWYAISLVEAAEQPALLEMSLAGKSRDQIASISRQKRNEAKNGAAQAVRLDSVKILLASGATLTIKGSSLNIATVVEILAEVLKEARKAAEQYDLKTFQSMMKDKAKG
jgi:ParB family transcriptional regulator, chromosome partitioning protein